MRNSRDSAVVFNITVKVQNVNGRQSEVQENAPEDKRKEKPVQSFV